jgi:hypothetical protein
MKIQHYIALILAAVLGVAALMLLSHSLKDKSTVLLYDLRAKNTAAEMSKQESLPYEFHYTGTEKWGNVFVVYRFNKTTGDIDRFSFTAYEEDKKTGAPQYDQVEKLNMLTGESVRTISSSDRQTFLNYLQNLNTSSKTNSVGQQ